MSVQKQLRLYRLSFVAEHIKDESVASEYKTKVDCK